MVTDKMASQLQLLGKHGRGAAAVVDIQALTASQQRQAEAQQQASLEMTRKQHAQAAALEETASSAARGGGSTSHAARLGARGFDPGAHRHSCRGGGGGGSGWRGSDRWDAEPSTPEQVALRELVQVESGAIPPSAYQLPPSLAAAARDEAAGRDGREGRNPRRNPPSALDDARRQSSYQRSPAKRERPQGADADRRMSGSFGRHPPTADHAWGGTDAGALDSGATEEGGGASTPSQRGGLSGRLVQSGSSSSLPQLGGGATPRGAGTISSGTISSAIPRGAAGVVKPHLLALSSNAKSVGLRADGASRRGGHGAQSLARASQQDRIPSSPSRRPHSTEKRPVPQDPASIHSASADTDAIWEGLYSQIRIM